MGVSGGRELGDLVWNELTAVGVGWGLYTSSRPVELVPYRGKALHAIPTVGRKQGGGGCCAAMACRARDLLHDQSCRGLGGSGGTRADGVTPGGAYSPTVWE
jgi:hypothetical protein